MWMPDPQTVPPTDLIWAGLILLGVVLLLVGIGTLRDAIDAHFPSLPAPDEPALMHQAFGLPPPRRAAGRPPWEGSDGAEAPDPYAWPRLPQSYPYPPAHPEA